MTLEQLAYLGEVLGAAGVIASLIYVARQLAQNTAAIQLTAASERVQRDYEIAAPLIEDREFAAVWARGESEFAELEPVDQLRLLWFERRAIVLWYHLYHLRQKGMLPDADWHEHTWIIRTVGRRQAVRATWQMFRDAYEPSFRGFVDGQFAVTDGGDEHHTSL